MAASSRRRPRIVGRASRARGRWRACSSVALLGAAVLLITPAPGAAAGTWLRPVPGRVVRPFDYSAARAFTGGAHRGADLAAAAGDPVRAACGGRVLYAAAVARLGRVVTVLCGAHRVTYLPLATVAVHRGATLSRGAGIGTVAAGHEGLHVGVRRAGSRWGYEDPLARMSGDAPARPAVRHRRRASGAIGGEWRPDRSPASVGRARA